MSNVQNVKMDAVRRIAPTSGWAPKDSFHRVMSELDASTGKLTGDQQQVFADLPIEEFTTQPSCAHKLTYDDAGGVVYSALAPVGQNRWGDMKVYGV